MPFDPNIDFNPNEFMRGPLPDIAALNEANDRRWRKTEVSEHRRGKTNSREFNPEVWQDDQIGGGTVIATQPAAALIVAQDSQGVSAKAEAADPTPEPASNGPLVLSPGSPLDSARELVTRRYMRGVHRTLHHRQGDYYAWTGTHYVDLPSENARAEAYAFLDEAVQVQRDQHVPFRPNKAKVTNVMDALAATAQLPHDIQAPAWLDRRQEHNPTEILSCTNGLLHLPTRTLLPHTPQFFGLNHVGYAFDPDAPEPKEWLAFLSSVWPDDQEQIDTLQEMMGLLLTQDTRHQKAFLIVGPKRSGKGTIARVLNAILGSENVVGPTLSEMAKDFGLEPLIGKPLAIVSDLRVGPRTDVHVITERLLAITGEDTQTIGRKYRQAWTGRLPTRFLITTNLLPNMKDTSGALVSRLVVLTMAVSFYGREDKALEGRLLKELPGILLWAMKGRDRLAERGHFIQPAAARQALRDLDDLSSPIRAFIRDCCTIDKHRCIDRDTLFAAWVEWCTDNGRDHTGTKESFGADLNGAVAGLTTTRPRDAKTGRRLRYYQGIDLKPVQATTF